MGARASKITTQPVICPETYNKEDFQKILTLYDKLDKDGNFGLENKPKFNYYNPSVFRTTYIKNLNLELDLQKIPHNYYI